METREPFAGTALKSRSNRRALAVVCFALSAVLVAIALRYGELAAWPLPALLIAQFGAATIATIAVLEARAGRPAWPWVTMAIGSVLVAIAVTSTLVRIQIAAAAGWNCMWPHH